MIIRPHGMGAFEFVVVAALRAAQLTRGCRPRIDGDHSTAVLAQREVAEGRVMPTERTTAEPAQVAHD
ncbi:MAG: DNA-directed RNA polymerase subunit omega [Vicinamibacterales bacterium]